MTQTHTEPQPQTLPSTDHAYVLAQGEGQHGHFLNHLATTKVSGADGALFSVVEFSQPRGFGPPLHMHDDEDELIIVLDGEVVFRSGENEVIAGAGATAYLPRKVPHTFQVLSATARMTSITARTGGHPLFDTFVNALAEPLVSEELPAPTEIDGGQVAQVGAAHNISVLGPPPPPLD